MCDTMQVYTKKKAGWRVKYGQVIRAQFLARPNRFIAHAALENGETAVCHVKSRQPRTQDRLRPDRGGEGDAAH